MQIEIRSRDTKVKLGETMIDIEENIKQLIEEAKNINKNTEKLLGGALAIISIAFILTIINSILLFLK